ncbi:deoxyribonuclease-1 [Lates calcarifer]|uniref:Deoxyribonuclease n=1 Tax=Lates calcarifer TaxID=8187 RepID=A0AAJ7PF09_LATCA|nr:deoxyribonuclease-1 [Lates calcarifer]
MRCHSVRLPLPLLLSFLTLLVGAVTVSGFRICSYNVQKFNYQKAKNYRVIHTLTRVLHRCDISLLQDVVDPDGKAIKALLVSLNRYRGIDRYEGNYAYKSLSSEALGKSADDMQQYVFIYRIQTVNVTGHYQYQKKDSFVREPFIVQFQSNKTAINEFVLVPLHTEPTKAVQEMDQLYDVFEDVERRWNNTNVMFLGDFHAGCAYMSRTDKKNIRLFSNTNFSWLIRDKTDTTLSQETNCPYDRIVVHGQPFLKGIKPFSAKVYNFAKELKLPRSKAREVSDHLPVEVTLKSPAPLIQATPLLVLLSVSAVVRSFL